MLVLCTAGNAHRTVERICKREDLTCGLTHSLLDKIERRARSLDRNGFGYTRFVQKRDSVFLLESGHVTGQKLQSVPERGLLFDERGNFLCSGSGRSFDQSSSPLRSELRQLARDVLKSVSKLHPTGPPLLQLEGYIGTGSGRAWRHNDHAGKIVLGDSGIGLNGH